MWRLSRIVDEVGGLAKSCGYYEYDESEGYLAEMKKSLGDIIAQVMMFICNEGFDIKEIEDIGYKELQYAIEKRLPK